jgi:hypothetical protein
MKPFLIILGAAILLLAACNPKNGRLEYKITKVSNDSIQLIRQGYKNKPKIIEYEIPVFKDTRKRHGVQKRFYLDGSLYSTIPYTYGKREGTAFTYYLGTSDPESAIWKEQPYKNNELEGTCRRYHRNGNLQAEYEYKNGLPAIGTKEFTESGKPIKMPTLILTKSKTPDGHYITARLSNNSQKVDYFIGNLLEGKYLPKNLKGLQVKEGLGEIVVYNTNKTITITAVYTSRYRNKCFIAGTISF